jgi:hypothetical protein
MEGAEPWISTKMILSLALLQQIDWVRDRRSTFRRLLY